MKVLSVIELIAFLFALVFMLIGDEIASLRFLVIAVYIKLYQMEFVRGIDTS